MKFLMVNLVKLKILLIEEFLKGEEMSYFIINDGKTIKNLKLLKIIKEFQKEIKEKILEVWVHTLHQDS